MKIEGIDAIRSAAKRLRTVPEASARAAYRAVNTVAARVSTMAKREIAAQINLPQSYIAQQMRIQPATAAMPVAEVRMRLRAVRLARFSAAQITKPARRAKGDPRRGIGAGRKQAGVAVKVARTGGRKVMPGAFLLPLRAGNAGGGNGMGVFIRQGSRGERQARAASGVKIGEYTWKGGIKHLYGPSPDQLFRRWRSEAAPDIKRLLFQAYASQLRFELRGSRK